MMGLISSYLARQTQVRDEYQLRKRIRTKLAFLRFSTKEYGGRNNPAGPGQTGANGSDGAHAGGR